MVQDSIIDLSEDFLNAVLSDSPSEGFTHAFYKYPARFSPEFARAAILTFTDPGDVVLDPFMGSGTTLVESLVLGRHAIGSDINPLAHFVTQVKTTLLSSNDFKVMYGWLEEIQPHLNLRRPVIRHPEWVDGGYQKDIPWPIRKTIELILSKVSDLPQPRQRRLVRCALLRTAQWALDCRQNFPSAPEFRNKFAETLQDYFEGLEEMKEGVKFSPSKQRSRIVRLTVPAAELDSKLWKTRIQQKPKLVVTSPPYPGVHVLYHRWQIEGRKETPAPFWIIGKPDGSGASHYTMGSRTPTGLDNYFESVEESYSRIHSLLATDALVVQLIAFSHVHEQLPEYLKVMACAGFQEVSLNVESRKSGKRIWRQVPLRRWYATYQGRTSSSRELLLVHKRG